MTREDLAGRRHRGGFTRPSKQRRKSEWTTGVWLPKKPSPIEGGLMSHMAWPAQSMAFMAEVVKDEVALMAEVVKDEVNADSDKEEGAAATEASAGRVADVSDAAATAALVQPTDDEAYPLSHSMCLTSYIYTPPRFPKV